MPLRARVIAQSFLWLGLTSLGFASFVRADSGGWTSIGPDTGIIFTIAVDQSHPKTIYVGTLGAGIFKTTNSGASWAAINAGLMITTYLEARARAIDKTNPNIIYAGTESGVCKSVNGGTSWASTSARPQLYNVSSIAIDPLDRQVIYAANDAGGVFVSTNGGKQWSRMSEGLLGIIHTTLAIDPSGSGMVYVGTLGDGIYKRRFIIPEIAAVDFDPFDTPEKLTVSGRRFGTAPRVLINGADRTSFIVSASDTSLKLKGKASGMNLRAGDNTIQVIGTDGVVSNIFTQRL